MSFAMLFTQHIYRCIILYMRYTLSPSSDTIGIPQVVSNSLQLINKFQNEKVNI